MRLSPTFIFMLCCCLNKPIWANEHYVIDPEHTFSSFEYQHWGLSAQRGRFDKSTGFIDLDMDNKSGSINIEIDATSVNTGSSLFDSIMRSSSFFDTQQFQKITFNSTKLVFDEDRLSQIEGNLTIKDSTRPVVIEITQFSCRFMLLYLKKACGANGYTKILRSDYKVDRYTPFVSDEVTLYFSVEGIKEE
jgi:polyisoprenoid-binding protein YceI